MSLLCFLSRLFTRQLDFLLFARQIKKDVGGEVPSPNCPRSKLNVRSGSERQTFQGLDPPQVDCIYSMDSTTPTIHKLEKDMMLLSSGTI